MFKTGIKFSYAVSGLTYLARNNRVVTCDEIAAAINAPRESLAILLKSLAKSMLVFSQRGTGGGFVLARPAEKITLLDIVEAVEGKLVVNKCLINEVQCINKSSCSVHKVWADIQIKIIDIYKGVTLKDLAEA